MSGLTSSGFSGQRLEEILTAFKDAAVQNFGDIVPVGDSVDTGSNSLLGRSIGLVSPSIADLWEAAQQIYSSFDPNSASGVALDNLVALAFISRSLEAKTTVKILSEASYNVTVPATSKIQSSTTGKQFEADQNIVFNTTGVSGLAISLAAVQNSTAYTITYTNLQGVIKTVTYTSDADATSTEILDGIKAVADSPAFTNELDTYYQDGFLYIVRQDIAQTIDFSVTANITIQRIRKFGDFVCTEFGPNAQDTATIQTIVTPVIGWLSVNNPYPAVTGRFTETDEELRLRFLSSKADSASSNIDAINSAIINTEGVISSIVYENETTTTDSFGIPPKAFMPIVRGGIPSQIAAAIWANKPAGIASHGNTSVVLNDIFGNPRTVKYEVPTLLNVYISLNLTTDGNFPGDGEELIKQALIQHFTAFGVGEDVIYSRLYTPINSVAGFQVNSLTIGTTPSPVGTSNIVVPFNQIAYVDASLITIVI